MDLPGYTAPLLGSSGQWVSFFFFWLTPKVRRVLKIVLGKWAALQHMIQWITAIKGRGADPKLISMYKRAL